MANESGAQADDLSVITGLSALRWTLDDAARAERLLALTGLSVSDLRAQAGDRAILAAVLRFLEDYEPDLLACADALAINPADLVATRRQLET